ncbi:MAG: glycosyltransferase family 4 protein [Chitinophagales bacterium]|nr:glycosyltransferase family 4 protein [Chitinophagales bacterium]
MCKKFPFPPRDGEVIAIWHLTQGFARKGHGVIVAALNTRKHFSDPYQLPDAWKQTARFYAVETDTRIRPATVLRSMLWTSSLQVERFYSRRFLDLLRHLVREHPFDIIQLEGSYLLPYVKELRRHSSAKMVLRSHNVEHQIWERQATSEPRRWRRKLLQHLARQLRRHELKYLNVCDALVPISQDDAAAYRAMGCRLPMHVCEVGVEVPFQPPPLPETPRLFFIGSLDWSPNSAGLEFFLREHWPGIRARFPQLTFHIAGRNSPDWLRNLGGEGVVFHGEVEDARSFMASGSILIVPVSGASGIRVKIAEALALGRVVVSTPAGALGLPRVSDNPVLIADGQNDFLSVLSDLLQSPERLQQIAARGHAFAKERLDAERLSEQLLLFYKSLLA